jgi:3-deoxy-D-manno-octulosonic-acid transferase
MARSVLHRLYLLASHVTAPVFARAQRRSLAAGKDDPARSRERWGRASVPRPAGCVVWFHAASVGETQSILPLIGALLARDPDVSVLVTSATRTSADMLARDLPNSDLSGRAVHQMVPYDTARAVRRFLDHWTPDVAIWIESELWPRLLREAGRRRIPRLLLNARVSQRTAKQWSKFPKTARSVLSAFDTIHAQDDATAAVILQTDLPPSLVRVTGALKQDRPSLPYDKGVLAEFAGAIGTRSVWCASSTHAGEEEFVLAAHLKIKGLLILVPRHPNRTDDILALCKSNGLAAAVRSRGETLTADTQVYIADTMGELGLWYRAAPVSFIGGSLAAIGGHNPYEPALLGSAIVHCPNVDNFAQIYDELAQAKAARRVHDADGLAAAVLEMQAGGAADYAARALDIAQRGQGTTDAALQAIVDHLPN